MRAVAVERAESLPASPVYQITVLAALPAIMPMAMSNGGPSTRWGGLLLSALKKSSDAVIDDAAVSEVAASLPIAVVSAVCRLAVVAAALAPIVNSLAPGGDLSVAVSVRFSLVPSGKLKRSVTVSPAFGTPADRSIESAAGEPAGPVTVP